MSIDKSIDEQIANFGMAVDLADALRVVAAKYGPEVARQTGYLSVRPHDRSIAAYFNKGHIDVAVEPLQVQAAAVANPGTRILDKRTPTTTYLRVPAGVLDETSIVQLVGTALAWRETGPRWSGESGVGFGADLAGESCGGCFQRLAVNGTCACD